MNTIIKFRCLACMYHKYYKYLNQHNLTNIKSKYDITNLPSVVFDTFVIGNFCDNSNNYKLLISMKI